MTVFLLWRWKQSAHSPQRNSVSELDPDYVSVPVEMIPGKMVKLGQHGRSNFNSIAAVIRGLTDEGAGRLSMT